MFNINPNVSSLKNAFVFFFMFYNSSWIHIPFLVFLINYFITLHTDCLIDILASPNFYTITFTSGLKFLSLLFIYSIESYRIFSVIPTILGFVSFNILIKLGKISFKPAWNYGLSIFACTLNNNYYAASVFYLIDP